MTQQQVWQWALEHQWIFWVLLSLAINLALSKRTVAGWVAFVEGYPRLASAVRLLRALGIDPIKAAEAVIGIVTGRARVPVAFAAPVPTATPVIPPPPREPVITERD